MADEQGANNLQTEDVNNHAAYGEPLKSPVVTNEVPSVNISNSKEANSADLQEESTEDAEREEEEEEDVQEENVNDDCSAENKDENVEEKEGEGDLQEDAELEQGEIADEEEEGMECDEESSEEDEESGEEDEDEDDETGEGDDDEGSEEGEVESGAEGEEEGEEEVEGEEGEEGISYEEDDTSLAEAGMSDSEAEKCPVCLCPFADQDVGTPESCDHTFCLECILEWSKNVNTCPVDRSLFRAILVRHSVGGEVVRHLDVDEPKAEGEGYEEDATYCEVCGRCDREDRLLLCDGCDAGYHCECLDPPLDHIPIEEWFCPECVARNRHQDTIEVEAGDESEDEWTTVEQRPSVVRAIARTRVSERVRAVITRARALRLRDEEEAQPSTSARRPRTSTTRRPKKKTRRRKTTKGKRRRKTTKSPRGKGKKGKVKKRGTKKVVRRKKGTRKQKLGGVRTVKRTPSTVRGRIAKSLQLVKPRTGSMMPDKKILAGRKSSMDYRLNEIGAAKLSIKGNDALFYSGDDGYSQQEVSTASLPSTSRSEPAVCSSGVPDLLGSIMAGQSILHMKSSDITIHRDGHLSVNKDKDDTSKSSPKKNPGNSNPISKESDNSEDNINDVSELFNQHAIEEGGGENQSPMDQDEIEDSDAAEDFVSTGLLLSNIQDDSEHKVSDEHVTEYENPGNERSDTKTDDHDTKSDDHDTKSDDHNTKTDDFDTKNDDCDTNIDDGDANIDDGDTNVDDGDTNADDGDTNVDDGDTIYDGDTKPDGIQNEDPDENVAEKEDSAEKENVDTVLSDFSKEMEKSVDDSNHAQDQLHEGQPDQSESCELENDTLLPPGNSPGDEPNSNDSSDLHDKSKDACEDAFLGQTREVEEGEHQQTQSESNVCNEKSTDEIPSTLSGKLEEDGEVNNKETEADNFNKSADEETVVTNAGEGNHVDLDKSVETLESATEMKDLTNNDSSTDKQTDIEVIKVVKGARTVTRKSIPDGSKNPAEAGEIEIIRVDIVNKPKRKDRRGGEKGGHASSSSFDSQSDEEGAIPEKRNKKGKAHSKMKKKDLSKRRSKDGDAKGKKMGDSSAEEGEVKSDEERAGGKRKKKRNKKKKNKDTRNVIVDSSNPKILIPELAKTPKVKLDAKKSDSESGKSRERGGYGDLRQVIQVKRDSLPEDDVRRYEAYWNEYGKRRGDERRVESSSQWEQLYSYSAYSFAEGKQWENFTVQRERSPIYDRRKEKENSSKRIESRRSSRGDRSSGHSRERQYKPEKETMAEKAVRLEREAAKRERQLQETRRGERHLTMAEREARELMRSRMDEHIERKYGKQGFLTEITRRDPGHNRNRTTARDKHGRERSYEHDYYRERSKDKSGDRKRLKEKEQKHYEDRSRERKRQRREASRSSRSRDEYSSDRHRSVDKRSYDSDISRSSSRSASVPSDKEPEPPKALPKTSSVPKPTPGLPGQKPDMVTKKKKKDKTKGKKDKKTKEAKKAAKKAKGLKAAKKDKADATGILAESAAAAAATAAATAAGAKRPSEGQANDQAPAKKQKKIKGKKDKKKKKAAKLAKLAAKAGNVPPPRPTCLIQDDEDPDIIDLTGEVEDRSPAPSTPPTPKPATPTKPPPKDPSPIVSSTADIRDSNNPSSSLYDPFEPTASPPVSYSNSPSPITSEGVLQARKGPSSSSTARVSRGSADREREINASKRPYSPRDAPLGRRSPQGSPPRATSSSTASSIAKLLPALSSQTNSQINQLLGSISSNPALQSVLSASAGSGHGTSLSGSQRSPSGSEQSFSKVSALGLESPRQEERRPTKDVDNIGEVTEEDIESSAVDLYNKNSRERYLKKLHHQERVVEEVKLAIKPHYQRREINKEEYKEILRKSVNQVCHSKSGEINPVKIRNLIEGYVKKAQTKRKLGTTMKPLIITSDRSRSSSKRGGGPNVLGKLIL